MVMLISWALRSEVVRSVLPSPVSVRYTVTDLGPVSNGYAIQALNASGQTVGSAWKIVTRNGQADGSGYAILQSGTVCVT